MDTQDLKKTPLFDVHVALGGKMVPFAGYSMPVQYPLGVMKEHLHTRAAAGLFDVSHMGQAFLRSKTDADIGKIFESLVPGNIAGLKPGRLRYTVFLNEQGGIMDDLMATRFEGEDNTLYLVVNAACKEQDFAHIQANLGDQADLEIMESQALLALQGPKAEEVLARLWPGAKDLKFMQANAGNIKGFDCMISRSGYTGEDGYEISVPNAGAEKLAKTLLEFPEVEAIGLGARDSLRLETGLCLYGHDLDETTSPIEGGIAFAVSKPRREAGDFPGAKRILAELEHGPSRLRVGIQPLTRAPAREGAEIVNASGDKIGTITSGGFGPSVGGPVAMGYVKTEYADIGTEVGLVVRDKVMTAEVAAMPFVSKSYNR